MIADFQRNAYRTDITDAEWQVLHPYVPEPKSGGRPAIHSRRVIVNAILYLLRSGCAWHLLPNDFPPWKTVYHSFRRWRLDGTWQRVHTALREQLRIQRGRHAQPTAGVIDSQSVKTTGGGGVRGYDGGKKVKGRKRHVLVDTQGFLLRAFVHSADVMDRDGVVLLLHDIPHEFPYLRHVWLDSGYNGRGKGKDWIERTLGWTVELVRHPRKVTRVLVLDDHGVHWKTVDPPTPGFRVLPRRWVVERTFAWLDQNRRLSKDDEYLPQTSETLIYIAMSRLMLRRLVQ